MIKNDVQLKQTQERLTALRSEKKALQDRYGGHIPDYLLTQLEEDEDQLQVEISEYQTLKQLPLAEAVEILAQNPELIENVGEMLAKLRIAAGLTQEHLAQKLGWEQANVSRFESSSYSSQTIGKIAEYLDGLGVSLHIIPSIAPLPTNAHNQFPEALEPVPG